MTSFYDILISCLVFLLSIWITISQHDIDYSDINAIDGSCYPRDSCSTPRRLRFVNRSCECDRKCRQFSDCCIDAPPYLSTYDTNPNIECSRVEASWGAYMILKCPTDYQSDAETLSKCENPEDISDPFSATPVTDISSNITYRNRYCAYCNNAQLNNLTTWNREVKCYGNIPNNTDLDTAYMENHLTFVDSERSSSWGFYYPEESSGLNGERQFYPCDVPYAIPDFIRGSVRLCRPNIISTCANNWDRPIIANKCQLYTAVVYFGSRTYKNPHCALCNRLQVKERMCNLPIGIPGRDKKPAASFTIILNVYNNESNKGCSDSQQWDPFAKKCQDVFCAPGYRIRNGACARP